LLERIAAGSQRFRLLRGRPSHEKLYLLSGPNGKPVLTGSANLSFAAFEGRQQEVQVCFDGEAAWTLFDEYHQRDWKDAVAAPAEYTSCVVAVPTAPDNSTATRQRIRPSRSHGTPVQLTFRILDPADSARSHGRLSSLCDPSGAVDGSGCRICIIRKDGVMDSLGSPLYAAIRWRRRGRIFF
jgi:hypothetical protein